MTGLGKLPHFTKEEIAHHNNEGSAWIILNNRVYDVTKFLLEHPGGEDVILGMAGQDATESFEDVGHSDDARELTNDYLIGHVKIHQAEIQKTRNVISDVSDVKCDQETWWNIIASSTWSNFLIPVGISILIYSSYRFIKFVTAK